MTKATWHLERQYSDLVTEVKQRFYLKNVYFHQHFDAKGSLMPLKNSHVRAWMPGRMAWYHRQKTAAYPPLSGGNTAVKHDSLSYKAAVQYVFPSREY